MPRRLPVPPVLVGRRTNLLRHFWRDHAAAVERERSLPRERRFVTHIGPSYAAIGWLLMRDAKYRKEGPTPDAETT